MGYTVRLSKSDREQVVLDTADTISWDSDGDLEARTEDGSLIAVFARGEWSYVIHTARPC